MKRSRRYGAAARKGVNQRDVWKEGNDDQRLPWATRSRLSGGGGHGLPGSGRYLVESGAGRQMRTTTSGPERSSSPTCRPHTGVAAARSTATGSMSTTSWSSSSRASPKAMARGPPASTTSSCSTASVNRSSGALIANAIATASRNTCALLPPERAARPEIRLRTLAHAVEYRVPRRGPADARPATISAWEGVAQRTRREQPMPLKPTTGRRRRLSAFSTSVRRGRAGLVGQDRWRRQDLHLPARGRRPPHSAEDEGQGRFAFRIAVHDRRSRDRRHHRRPEQARREAHAQVDLGAGIAGPIESQRHRRPAPARRAVRRIHVQVVRPRSCS